MNKLMQSAWAFVCNPEARASSEYTYPNGAPMSIREARQKGFVVSDRIYKSKGDILLITSGILVALASVSALVVLIVYF